MQTPAEQQIIDQLRAAGDEWKEKIARDVLEQKAQHLPGHSMKGVK